MSTLEEKIEAARALLAGLLKEHAADRVAVAWTGGKDSTVALDLWRELLAGRGLAQPHVISIDTGLKFRQIVAFRDQWAAEWGLGMTIARPDIDLAVHPVAEDKVACCAALKVEPLHRAISEHGFTALITGLRRDEHESRQGLDALESRSCGEHGPEYVQANPLLDFTEMDVWSCIASRGLPFCELYGRGYRSLGCVPCTTKSGGGERSGRDQDKEAQLRTLKSLGYF